MSDLYTEALKNAEKLREIAEQDAKKRIIEALTPYIKKVIAKEAAGEATDFYFEQAEDLSQLPDEDENNPVAPETATQGAAPTSDPTAIDPATTDPTQDLSAGPLGDQSTEAPIDATPAPVTATTGPDGKMKIGFDNLTVDATSDEVTITPHAAPAAEPAPTAPVQAKGTTPTTGTAPAPTAAPAPVPGAEQAVPPEEEDEDLLKQPVANEAISYSDYQRVYSNIAEKIDRALFTGNLSNVGSETLKQRLFGLLEAVDTMRDRGAISNKLARTQENKLEFLFLKLKEANVHNSYFKNNSEKGPEDMKTLKEFAAQLFEEDENLAKDSVSTGETGVKVDNEKTEHAQKVSGVSPKLGSKKDIKVAAEGKASEADAISGSVEDDTQWADGEPVVKENSANANKDANPEVKKGAGGFGDTDEEPVAEPMTEEFEIDEAELSEAVRSVRKESLKRKLAALREETKKDKKSPKVKASEDYPNPGPEGGEDPSHDHLKEGLEDMMAGGDADADAGLDGASDGADEMGDMDSIADLVLSIDLPPEVEAELAKLGVVSDDLDVDVKLNVGGEEHADADAMGGDDEIEITDDGDADDIGGSEEKDEMLADDVDESAAMPMETKMENASAKHLARKVQMLESKLTQASKLLEAKDGEMSELKGQLSETNLFTAKTVYYSKFLQRALTEKALSKKVLQQIVEHLDRAKTIAESKAIFTSIKRKLDEHASASLKLGGSSSKVAKPGSASLTESVSRDVISEGIDPNSQTPMRWQILAGIKKGE